MICYKDKTWCNFYPICKHGYMCDRALTPKIIQDSKEWWGGHDAPISVYSDFPECFVRFFEED